MSYNKQKGRKLSYWAQVDNRLKAIRAEVKQYDPRERETMTSSYVCGHVLNIGPPTHDCFIYDRRIIAGILTQDTITFPVKSGALLKGIYEGAKLNPVQQAAMRTVAAFKVNDVPIAKEPMQNEGVDVPEETAAAVAASAAMLSDMLANTEAQDEY